MIAAQPPASTASVVVSRSLVRSDSCCFRQFRPAIVFCGGAVSVSAAFARLVFVRFVGSVPVEAQIDRLDATLARSPHGRGSTGPCEDQQVPVSRFPARTGIDHGCCPALRQPGAQPRPDGDAPALSSRRAASPVRTGHPTYRGPLGAGGVHTAPPARGSPSQGTCPITSCRVSPARTGMNRRGQPWRGGHDGFPRTPGDEPDYRAQVRGIFTSAPHARGSTRHTLDAPARTGNDLSDKLCACRE